jgi:hypothetical protein
MGGINRSTLDRPYSNDSVRKLKVSSLQRASADQISESHFERNAKIVMFRLQNTENIHGDRSHAWIAIRSPSKPMNLERHDMSCYKSADAQGALAAEILI